MLNPVARALVVAVTLGAAGLCPAGAAASSQVVPDDELARRSAAAVRGRVVALASAWDADADAIYTFVTLDVLQAWGLSGSPARVVLKQLGGVVADTAFVVGGQARFEVGEDVLVFVDVRPRDRTLSVAGLERGKWTLTGSADPAAAMARDIRGADPSVVVARDSRSLVDLQALASLAGTQASAAAAVLVPSLGAEPTGVSTGRSAPAYSLLNPSLPARWHQADTATPVYVDSQTDGHPQIAGGGLTQLARAAALWGAAGSLPLQAGGTRGPRCFQNSEPSDGRISVTYGDPCGEIADSSATLAIGGAYFTSDTRVVNGVSYWRITKGMVVTDNPAAKFSGMSTGCYEELLAHELGHAIGFGHAAARPAVMYGAISSNCWSRTTSLPLQADDLAAVAALYPRADGITAPNAPANLAATVSGATVTITWSPASSGSAATAYQLLAGSAPGLANYGAINTPSTSIVVPGVPNGTYFVRVVAGNAAGMSAPTSDLQIRVGPAPPGAPRTLTAQAGAGGSVYITWQPPSSGGTPTSYVLRAGYAPGATSHQIPVNGTVLAGAGIPAATYYVRVVAVNAAGASVASNEVALVVP
jgi:hypothetical protein